ncbi:MAG: ABC transporter permease, partial [Mesobacillus sp.]
NSMRLDLVMAGILFIGISGLLLDKAVGVFEAWINRQWGKVNN